MGFHDFARERARRTAWSTHTGGQHWSGAVNFPVKSASPLGVEDIEASAGVVDAAVQVGAEVEHVPRQSRVMPGTSKVARSPGRGARAEGQLALQGTSGWFVEDNRVAVSGARREPSGVWTAWRHRAQAPAAVMLSAVTSSNIDAVARKGCGPGTWSPCTCLRRENGGASFARTGLTPFTSVQAAAGERPATLAVVPPRPPAAPRWASR